MEQLCDRFYLFWKIVCFQVCCSSSFLFPEVQWRKNWGQVSQWQAVIADLFPMQHVLPAAAFPGWNITLNSDNGWGSDTFCINESCVSASKVMYSRGYFYRTIRGVIWSGKNGMLTTPEGEQNKLVRCHYILQSHCNLCHVENCAMLVLMMMTIVAQPEGGYS